MESLSRTFLHFSPTLPALTYLYQDLSMMNSGNTSSAVLCRYITRPAICLDRLNIHNDGQIQYELKNPFRNGTTHILFSPLDFLSKLAAVIPRPRHHLVRYHGIFAPNARIRKRIVPTKGKKTKTSKKSDKGEYKAETVAKVDDALIAPLSWAQRLI